MKYRILSFCMALLLIIPMTINQFAEAADNTESFKDSADIKKVRLLEALGLMEIDSETGFFWDEMPVKRSDLAKIICKMFDISETADASPHFVDVKEADRAYVETTVRNGYMSGYSDEKFGADDYVTNMQLIKIFVTVLGGKEAAEAQGGFPEGYITIGKMLGLMDAKIAVNDDAARRIDVANIIYTALHADVLECYGVSGNKIQYKTIDGYTFLTEKRNIYRVEGIIKQNEATSLNRSDGLGKSLIMIGKTIHRDDNHLTDDYLGCDVECYVQIPKGDSIGTIVYVQENNQNKTLTITDEDVISVDDNKVRYYDKKDKERNINMSVTYDMIYNGKAVDHISGTKLERLPSLDNADIKFIDNNGDGKYEVAIVTEYITRVVYSVNAEEEKISFKFDEQPLNLIDSYYSFFKDGKRTELDEINPGDVLLLAISENEDNEKVVKGHISTQYIQGEVRSNYVDPDDNKTYVVISEKEYRVSTYCKDLANKNKIYKTEPGVSGTFYLDARGNIAYIDGNAEGDVVAFLIDGKLCNDYDGSEMLLVKLFDENRSSKKFIVKDSIIINSKKVKLNSISDAVKEQLNTPQLIKYTAKDDELKEIVLPEQGYDVQNFSMDDGPRGMLCTHNKVLDDKYYVEPDAKIFYIPDKGKDDASYDEMMDSKGLLFILPSQFISGGDTHKVSVYDVNENGGVKYLLIRYGYSLGGNLVGAGHGMVAVNEVEEFYDEDREEVNYRLQGYDESGNLTTVKLSEASKLATKVAIVDKEKGVKNYSLSNLREVKPGDIVQVHWDSQGRCDDMWIQHSYEDTDYYSPVIMDFDTQNKEQRCIFGQAVFVSSSNIIVSGTPDEYTGPVSGGNKYIGNNTSAVYKWTGKQYVKIEFDEIEQGDKVFAAVGSSNNTRIIVVYK